MDELLEQVFNTLSCLYSCSSLATSVLSNPESSFKLVVGRSCRMSDGKKPEILLLQLSPSPLCAFTFSFPVFRMQELYLTGWRMGNFSIV
jgi:hypothetical protein